jgi:hypothetical protein
MYIDYSTWETFEYKVSSLRLDVNNPRIRHIGKILNQNQILKLLLDKEKVYELAKKISEEGYFVGEEPIICIENDKKVVLEGNRRIAALKLLQDPKKYLPINKANTLLQNVLRNNIQIDNCKIKCHIAPNRLLANPIIYERHKGEAVYKWKTGNQYSFVAEMYEKDGLSIDDICDILNETRGNVLRPLKAYHLFSKGKEIVEKEGMNTIDIEKFDLTNLERFYKIEEARKFLGIDFDNDTGKMIVKLPWKEFEKRIMITFKELSDTERFSREYNTREDLEKFVDKLKENPDIDISIVTDESITRSQVVENRKSLEDETAKTTTRRKRSKQRSYFNSIPRDKEIIFDNEKLDSLFTELKTLPVEKKYSFSVLLRSYLEQSLYFYLETKKLLGEVSSKAREEHKNNNLKKVKAVITYIDGIYLPDRNVNNIDPEKLMNILKFNVNKEFLDLSLQSMLDYVVKQELVNYLDTCTYKNTKDYIERIKMGLDLAVHNNKTIIDVEHNKRAWQHLEPLFTYLSESINTKE